MSETRAVNPVHYLLPLVKGAIAGFVATIPMTVFMLVVHRLLPKTQKQALPPKKIAMALSERVGLKKHMDKEERLGVTLASHFGYGTSSGAMYAATGARLPLPGPINGILFASALWAAGYAGWIPAMKILPPPWEKPPPRVALMVGAHVVWGAVAGTVLSLLARRDDEAD